MQVDNHVGRVIEIHHVPAIADKTLDITCNPQTIKTGFRSSGIFPFDRYIFSEADFVAADVCGENVGIEDEPDDAEHGRYIMINVAQLDTGAHEEVTTSEAPTSMASPSTAPSVASTSGISEASLQRALSQVGPLKVQGQKKKSNRGRKPGESAILTSPENVAKTRCKADAKKAKQQKAEMKKGGKQSGDGPEKKRARTGKGEPNAKKKKDDVTCMICGDGWRQKQTKNNTINCNDCERPAHLACAIVTAGGFTCNDCDAE